MSNKDFRIATSFLRHPKIVKLKKKHHCGGVLFWISLLAYMAEHKPRGIIDVDPETLKIATGYTGDIDAILDTMIEIGLLDHVGNTLEVHDWKSHNGYAYHSEERSNNARKKAEKRWSE